MTYSFNQQSVNHLELSIAHIGQLLIVGYNNKGLLKVFAQIKKEAMQIGRRSRIQVAGGLICKNDSRLIHQRACYRDALLLPPRQLIGLVVQSVGQSKVGQQLRCPAASLLVRLSVYQGRNSYIFKGRKLR